jgi:ribosomal protein L37AE/L43A
MDKLICPLCDKTITGFPALSRKDNSTYICSDCGTVEAMEDYFFATHTKLTENK